VTGHGARNKLVPAVPRFHTNRAAELQPVSFQELAVEDLLACLVGQPEDSDRQTSLSTDYGAKIATVGRAEVERLKYRRCDHPQAL